LDEIARKLVVELQNEGIQTEYDDAGAIGRRYRRQDEIGTPVCVTIDYDTKKDTTATLRDRDSMKQVRLPLVEIPKVVYQLIKGKKTFDQLRQFSIFRDSFRKI
ncbi:MAG: hypothetical protein LBH02_03140, partial [Methanocalculaceae archaeon]|jgi:glycyl-tRNA synthetase|nr:hypothetical protein [Methanocalculaceae archaeon]